MSKKIDLTDYEVTKEGEVISYKGLSPRVLKPWVATGGYLAVKITQNKIAKSFSLHRIVMQVHGNHTPIKGMDIDHIDNDKTNNNINNLQVISHYDNCQKKVYTAEWREAASKRMMAARILSPEVFCGAFAEVLHVESGVIYNSLVECSEALGVNKRAVSSQLRGRTKNTLGVKYASGENKIWTPKIATGIKGVTTHGKGYQSQIKYKGINVPLGSDKCKYVCGGYYEGMAETIYWNDKL